MYACFFIPVIDCTCVLHRRSWAAQPAAVAAEPTQFFGFADSPVLFTGRWLEVTWPPLCFKLGHGFTTPSSQTLLRENRQCCESWRDAELGDRAVCAVGDTTGEDLVLVRWVVLLCFSPHRELSNERYDDHIQFKSWLLRRLTPGITDRSPSVLRRQQSVSSVSSTTPLPWRVCCSAPAACR